MTGQVAYWRRNLQVAVLKPHTELVLRIQQFLIALTNFRSILMVPQILISTEILEPLNVVESNWGVFIQEWECVTPTEPLLENKPKPIITFHHVHNGFRTCSSRRIACFVNRNAFSVLSSSLVEGRHIPQTTVINLHYWDEAAKKYFPVIHEVIGILPNVMVSSFIAPTRMIGDNWDKYDMK